MGKLELLSSALDSAVTQGLIELLHAVCEENASVILEMEPELANFFASLPFHGILRNSKLMARCGAQLIFGVSALWAAADVLAEDHAWAMVCLEMLSGATMCILDASNPSCPAYFSAIILCASLLRRAQGCDLATLVPAVQQLERTAAKPSLSNKEAKSIILGVHSVLDAKADSGVGAAEVRTWTSFDTPAATRAAVSALHGASQSLTGEKHAMMHQSLLAVALCVRLLTRHSSPDAASELREAALSAGWPPMQTALDAPASEVRCDVAEEVQVVRPPAADSAAAAPTTPVGGAARQRGGGPAGPAISLTADVPDVELLKEHGLPVPLHVLPEASTLSKLLSDPAQAAAEVQVTGRGSSLVGRNDRNICVGILESFAERVRALCTTPVATGALQQASCEPAEPSAVLALSQPGKAPRPEGWRDAPIPDILDAHNSWGFLRDLQHFIVAPFGTGIRPAAVNAVVALSGSPCSLPRAWVVDITRVIITAAADTDSGLTSATYDALSTLSMWRLPLADVVSLILDSMCGKSTPLHGPTLPAVMPVGSAQVGLVGSTPPTLSSLSTEAPPRLQRTLLWLVQAMRHARGGGGAPADDKSKHSLLSSLRSREVSHMGIQPVCMGPQAWLHLGQALGVVLQHRNEQVRDAAAVALGEALSLVGDSPALRDMMQEVDLLKAARMVAQWANKGGEGGIKQPGASRRGRTRGAAAVGGGARMRRTERLGAAPSPPSLPLAVPPHAFVGTVPVFQGAEESTHGASRGVQLSHLATHPLLEQSTALWHTLGLSLPPPPFNLAFIPTLRHLSEQQLAQELLHEEATAVTQGGKAAEEAVAEVVASAGNLLYTAVELRAYKLQLVCLLLLRRHARIVARINMLPALPQELQKLLGKYNIPGKSASLSFASHRRALRAAAASELNEGDFMGNLSSTWGMRGMQQQLVQYFREHFRGILRASKDPLPELVPEVDGTCAVVSSDPAQEETQPTPPSADAHGVLVVGAGGAAAAKFTCLIVPSSFLQAVLVNSPSASSRPSAVDCFLLFAQWLRPAVKHGDTRAVELPAGVLEGDVRSIAWEHLHPEQLSRQEMLALSAAFPRAFALLDAGKVLQALAQ